MMEETAEQVTAWVRRCSLGDLDEDAFCPVELRDGYINPDTEVFTAGIEFAREDYFFNPGFLVILLGGVNRETSVENAALAIQGKIRGQEK
jgi:hypothetical protein